MLTDEVWQVIVAHVAKEGFMATNLDREYIEDISLILPFEGGAFVIYDNEIDLFVAERMRGKWPVKRYITAMFDVLAEFYESAIVRIKEDNAKSLRLAKFFGFKETRREGREIYMRKELWVEQHQPQ